MYQFSYLEKVERWDMQEIVCQGPSDGNPFADVQISGRFSGNGESVCADGFYDGNGIYKVRFMPAKEGRYSFTVDGGFLEEALEGSFEVTPAKAGNHGPVRVADTFSFAYEDGTPYYSIGTTCYVWELQSDEMIEKTLETLKSSAFNKIRFCIFPKHYDYNLEEPRSYPYEGKPMDSRVLTRENFLQYNGRSEGNDWDFARFHPAHFGHVEKCIKALQKLGIEADLILMHPYDRWGFSCMTKDEDDLYWKYVLARFSAFRNVWWSLANEYDLMKEKTEADWERYAALIREKDSSRHLCSIHNCGKFYDYGRPWITHCSIQNQELGGVEKIAGWRKTWQKPIVMDEMAYEGNIQHGWGSITAQEMVRRFWETALRGGYPGHGETLLHPDQKLWWSHGGVLRGESHKRFSFLYDILLETPGNGLTPLSFRWDEVCAADAQSAARSEEVKNYYLIYYSYKCPAFKEYYFDDHTRFRLKIIDTWNMTAEDGGIVSGRFQAELGGRQYMAIQLKKV